MLSEVVRRLSKPVSGERKKSHVPGALDRSSQQPLMLRTSSRLTTGADFAMLVDESFEQIRLLIVNDNRFIYAEFAFPRPASIPALTSGPI